VRCIQSRLNDGNFRMSDGRGQPNNKWKQVPDAIRQLIQNDINQYPRYLSHYKRALGDPLQPFLHYSLNISTMIRAFKEKMAYTPGLNTCDWIYRDEFRKLGLKFQSVRSYTCKKCDEIYIKLMDCRSEEETIEVTNMINAHHLHAESAYANMSQDFTRAKHDESFECLAVDLQQVCTVLYRYPIQLRLFNIPFSNRRFYLVLHCDTLMSFTNDSLVHTIFVSTTLKLTTGLCLFGAKLMVVEVQITLFVVYFISSREILNHCMLAVSAL